ncbi:glutamate racemase [candidate division WOR-1 bacterium RIFOXYC2_FULL_37_10]|uniref:Glutamate racemase n=1 Tax=candidate division WOR-1 bacterium RIFOXYB2_FULL_37_13 TaxID=1802579 RepID=A0A1F4SSM3_UNCSA|nr:MAG: glutamate racemase [candidate division WOR-1 bacterium RIFOXYA2_FULL_37_7]OGC23445.1 MAG: glutamate racemase [candidate division WOR-1 bacterium RIFOXYB2_FULL_37_13]OGC33511.1 MAG: glutamate racemase [candidate division WOR-1 bacterium RIFOXYC2_FULL_37_10]
MGIFDSGVGGLTVLKQVMKVLPQENVIFLGDTARVPYGGRSVEEIVSINREILDYFLRQQVDMVIMACGTSSAIAYPVLKEEYKFPIISLIEPGAKAALAATKNFRIGLIATIGTVQSQAYQKAIKSINAEAKVFAQGAPLFVPLIEGGFIEGKETKKIAREYLQPLMEEKVDTIILGCTHYPHLRDVIQEIVGEDVSLVDPAKGATLVAKAALLSKGKLNDGGHKGHYHYFVTGSPAHFEELGSKLLNKNISGVKQVRL